ncbi:MAG: ABC transporter ATP-binding protein [Firmicutes bacterium HGW-Firmicutes-12]|nr:MAG: ABC transporter ATP-binding protein [Firmicutes bacterium HGW-Firmicutes-12]
MNFIEVKSLTKTFGNVTALKNINLKFEGNKIYGLLGRNGAGKTTLLNIINNRIFPDSGEVLIDGVTAFENDYAQRNVYLMSEKNYYPLTMKVNNVFKWTNEFYPLFDMDYAKELTAKFGLNPAKKVKELSTGYNSIFKIIIALSVNTPYILLDEPVLGLDANHRAIFYKTLIENYNANPKTIIISTHLIDEVANVLEDIIIINQGEILKNESCEQLLTQGYTVTGSTTTINSFIADKNTIGYDTLGGLKTAYIYGSVDKSELPTGVEISKLDLQRLFIQLTNS